MDIYGYNLATHEEFPICTESHNQGNPVIYENIVVWQDFRNDDGSFTNDDLYGAILEEEVPLGPAAFRPVAMHHLREVNKLSIDIEGLLPPEIPPDIQALLDNIQECINKANKTGNSIYANNELLKALKLLNEVLSKL